MPTRRQQLADAAIAVVADEGVRGLTHRAVDLRAGLPTGSASNVFRSRDTLVAGIAERLVELDTDQEFADTTDPAEVIDQLVGWLLRLTTERRTHTRARLMLFLDRPEQFEAGHRQLLTFAQQILARHLHTAGSPADLEATARAVAALLDGVLLHAVTVRAGEPLDEASLRLALERLVLPGGR